MTERKRMTQSGTVALVRGASDGICGACADRLAGGGWTVIGASRRGTSSGNTGTSNWSGMALNVDEDAAVTAAVASIAEQHGRLDAVVAAAGWGVAGAAEFTTISAAKAQFETNFWGCVRMVQATLPLMLAQHTGRIGLVRS